MGVFPTPYGSCVQLSRLYRNIKSYVIYLFCLRRFHPLIAFLFLLFLQTLSLDARRSSPATRRAREERQHVEYVPRSAVSALLDIFLVPHTVFPFFSSAHTQHVKAPSLIGKILRFRLKTKKIATNPPMVFLVFSAFFGFCVVVCFVDPWCMACASS